MFKVYDGMGPIVAFWLVGASVSHFLDF